jgi:DNA-binding winged helix-turn-helix (wHTH) protein
MMPDSRPEATRLVLIAVADRADARDVVTCLLGVEIVPVLADSVAHAQALIDALTFDLALLDARVLDADPRGSQLVAATGCEVAVVGHPARTTVPPAVPELDDSLGAIGVAMYVERQLRALGANGLVWGPLLLDLRRREARWDGETLHLSCMQFRILATLAHASGAVVTRAHLCRRLFGTTTAADLERLDAHVRRLRKIIEVDPANPTFLLTVRGEGVRLAEQDAGLADGGGPPSDGAARAHIRLAVAGPG